MDGPEVIMDAEEYLQPKSRAPLPSTSTVETPLPPATPVKKFANGNGQPAGSEAGTLPLGAYGAEAFVPGQRGVEPTRFGHPYHPGQVPVQFQTHPCQQANPRDSGGPSLRYCSDPLQLIGKGTFENPKPRRIGFLMILLKCRTRERDGRQAHVELLARLRSGRKLGAASAARRRGRLPNAVS